MSEPLVLGLDVGGTATRAVVTDLSGEVAGAAQGAGGNPVAHGTPVALARIGDTLRAALAGLDPSRVVAGVVGLAGSAAIEPSLIELWPAVGLTVVPRLVGDIEPAFASGTARPAGSVLISGTGAVAAEFRDHRPVRLADGRGWLLGDRGSGYWLGRAAIRLTLDRVDRGLGPTALTGSLLDAVLGDRPAGPRSALLAAVYADPPVRLARLAPLVLAAADAADPDARRLVARAADHLVETLSTVRPADSGHPIVLAGGVLHPDSPLTAALRPHLAARWPAIPPTHPGNPAGAAAWLAARPLLPPARAALLHARFVGAPG